MIQWLLLTLFFIDNKPTQTPQLSPFPVETTGCEFAIVAYITIHVCATMTWPSVIYFIKHPLDFCKVRIKVSSTLSKVSRTYFLIYSHCHHHSLHCLILTLQSNYDAYCHSFSTRKIDLHIDSTRIFGCCTGSLVILVVQVDLCILSVRSTECEQVMSCIGVG